MTTRTRTIGVVTVCLVLFSTFLFQTYRTLVMGGGLDDVAKLVPDDSFLFIASRGAGDLSMEFSELGTALSEAGPNTQSAMEILTEVSMEFLGFD